MEKVAISPERILGIFRFGFVLGGAMMIFVTIMIPRQAQNPPNPMIELILTGVGLFAVFLGFLMPRLMRSAAMRAGRAQTGPDALNSWLSGNLAGLAWIFSCNLFAVVLHFLGAKTGLVELLFGVGMVSLLAWRGTAPPAADGENRTQM